MTAEAPGEVERLVAESAKASAGKKAENGPLQPETAAISDDERRDLEALIDLAQRRLQRSKASKEGIDLS